VPGIDGEPADVESGAILLLPLGGGPRKGLFPTLGLPPAGGRLFALGPASVSVFEYERENRVITIGNQDWHLAWQERP
jgi:hypothetical protein